MRKRLKMFLVRGTGAVLCLLVSTGAFALDLDWSGAFRVESHSVFDYTLSRGDSSVDSSRLQKGGYYIPGGGQTDAHFQTLFLKLTPVVHVNDNISIRTQWWLGHPSFGFFGSGLPYDLNEHFFLSSQMRSAQIKAQRYYLEVLTSFGRVQVGRAPLDWGLGLVWDQGKRQPFYRYASTADTLRIVSKVGSFTFVPSYFVFSQGDNVGGACSGSVSGPTLLPTGGTNAQVCQTQPGDGSSTGFSLALTYQKEEEKFSLGLNFIRYLTGAAQIVGSGVLVPGMNGVLTAGSMNLVIWDIYGKKIWGPLEAAFELPIVSGKLGSMTVGSIGAVVQVRLHLGEQWSVFSDLGYVPGQDGNTRDFQALYLHPNYRLGLLMFHYQLSHFAGPNLLNHPATSQNRLLSPFDSSVTNAKFATLGAAFQKHKWTFRTKWAIAVADQVAKGGGSTFFNQWDRSFYTNNGSEQSSFLGWEMDYGVRYQWDDFLKVQTDLGFFFPGAFYAFSNAGTPNGTSMAWGFHVGAVVSF